MIGLATAVRFVHLAAVILLTGAVAFLLLVARPAFQRAGGAYALFRRTLAAEGLPPVPAHLEFLIDRQGYIRARWIPAEGPGWGDVTRLLQEIDRLDKEAPRAPAPEEHVH